MPASEPGILPLLVVPAEHRWIFWEVDADQLDLERDADFILARVLERGGIEQVRWLMRDLGLERIHRFFRDVGHPELSARTIRFWRVVLHAEDESWATSPAWRSHSSAPWID